MAHCDSHRHDTTVVGREPAPASRGWPGALRRRRDALLAPGTLVLFTSVALFVGASAIGGPGDAPHYLAAALFTSGAVWWSALRGIRAGIFNAAIPASLALAGLVVFGEYTSAALMGSILLLGDRIEHFVAARADRAIADLSGLLPEQATVRRDGQDLTVPLDEVAVGDVCLVRPGERIAVDGEVLSGTASVDQAPITGESMPVEKVAGDPVYAGTLNQNGVLTVRAAQVGSGTTVGQVRRLVAQARREQAPIERLLNRHARRFTPLAVLFGLLLWLVTHDLELTVILLVLWCPCVIPLTTPMALSATITNAASRGALVKKAATIEVLARVDVVCFDKTGTLTLGEPRLVETTTFDGVTEAELLRLTASAEKYSEHPTAAALVAAAADRGITGPDPDGFEPLPGRGVQATVAGARILVGRLDLLTAHGVAVGGAGADRAGELARPGRTVVAVARDGRLIGLFAVEDGIRPEAAAAVRRLGELGIRTVLVSGDNAATAGRVAARLGIGDVHAGVLPERKATIVRQLRAAGHRVAFVGDGINDGPALATADVGIAMGRAGTDLAIDAADVSLLSDDLSGLPHLVEVSRRAIRTIGANVAFLLAGLTITIGLAAAGLMTLAAAAVIHALLSPPPILNSASLRWRGRASTAGNPASPAPLTHRPTTTIGTRP